MAVVRYWYNSKSMSTMEPEQPDKHIPKKLVVTQRLERDDYNHALSGVETGRMPRFGAKSKAELEKKQKKAERVFRDALDRFLQDPDYRALYVQLGQRLNDAEQEADTVLAETQAALRNLSKKIAEMEGRAATGPDGQLVFLTADGRVVDGNAEELPPEIAEGIIWPANAPTAEEYFGALEYQNALTQQLEEWQSYRTDTLGDIRNRYDDRENPMSIEGMNNALEAIDAARPLVIAAEASKPSQEAELSVSPASCPTIGK